MNWLPGMPSVSSRRLDRQQLVHRRPLGERRDELAVDDVDAVVRAGQVVVGDEPGERQDVGERGPVAEALEVGLDRDAGAAHRVAALAADGDDARGRRACSVICLGREPDRVRVERPGQAAVGRDRGRSAACRPRAGRGAGAPRRRGPSARSARTSSSFSAYGRGVERRVLGALQLGRGHELHRPGDLLDVPDGGDPPPDLALAGHSRRGSSRGTRRSPRRAPSPARRSGSWSCPSSSRMFALLGLEEAVELRSRTP